MKKFILLILTIGSLSSYATVGTTGQVYNYTKMIVNSFLSTKGLNLKPETINIKRSKYGYPSTLTEWAVPGESDIYYINFIAQDSNGNETGGEVRIFTDSTPKIIRFIMHRESIKSMSIKQKDPYTGELFFLGVLTTPELIQ